MRRGTVVLLAGVLLLAACANDPAPGPARNTTTTATPEGTATGDAADLLRGFVDAINGKDLDAYIRLFHDDAVFVDAGRRFTGREQIRRFGASLIEDLSHYEIVELTGDDGKASMVFDYVAGEGGYYTLDNARGDVTAENGLIRSLRLD
jgi:hypothetical protein